MKKLVAIDGIEVLAVIFAKKIGITVGTFVMCFNLVVHCSGINRQKGICFNNRNFRNNA